MRSAHPICNVWRLEAGAGGRSQLLSTSLIEAGISDESGASQFAWGITSIYLPNVGITRWEPHCPGFMWVLEI